MATLLLKISAISGLVCCASYVTLLYMLRLQPSIYKPTKIFHVLCFVAFVVALLSFILLL